MEALAEIQYEIGCRISVHLKTWWRRGQKMKGLCKEDKGEGRWETAQAFGGYLCSPQTEKHILLYFQSHTPTPSLHTYTHDTGSWSPDPASPTRSFCRHTFSPCLCLSLSSLYSWSEIRPETRRDYSSSLQFITPELQSESTANTLHIPWTLVSLLFPLS